MLAVRGLLIDASNGSFSCLGRIKLLCRFLPSRIYRRNVLKVCMTSVASTHNDCNRGEADFSSDHPKFCSWQFSDDRLKTPTKAMFPMTQLVGVKSCGSMLEYFNLHPSDRRNSAPLWIWLL